MHVNLFEDTLTFLKAVYRSEKEALERETARLEGLEISLNEKGNYDSQTCAEYKKRLAFSAKYESEHMDSFLLNSVRNGFICPRCLIHNMTLTDFSLYFESTTGEGELGCNKCNLSYETLLFTAVPTPLVGCKA